MDVTLIGTKVTQNINTFAFEKNNGVDVINVTVDTDESWKYKLDVRYSQKLCSGETLYNVIDLTRTGNICSVTLTSGMLPFSGKYILQLRGINSDGRVYHSEQFNGWVKYSIDPGAAYDPVPSEFYQIEDNITEINNHPPIPDSSGFWKIYNPTKHEYELSDIPLPGIEALDRFFAFTQATASDKWEITHNLYKYPSVTIVDSGNTKIVGDVEYNTLNTLTVSFNAPFAGQAYLN